MQSGAQGSERGETFTTSPFYSGVSERGEMEQAKKELQVLNEALCLALNIKERVCEAEQSENLNDREIKVLRKLRRYVFELLNQFV